METRAFQIEAIVVLLYSYTFQTCFSRGECFVSPSSKENVLNALRQTCALSSALFSASRNLLCSHENCTCSSLQPVFSLFSKSYRFFIVPNSESRNNHQKAKLILFTHHQQVTANSLFDWLDLRRVINILFII